MGTHSSYFLSLRLVGLQGTDHIHGCIYVDNQAGRFHFIQQPLARLLIGSRKCGAGDAAGGLLTDPAQFHQIGPETFAIDV